MYCFNPKHPNLQIETNHYQIQDNYEKNAETLSKNDNRHYLQIETNRFYLKNSYQQDVEAFLGTPSSITFHEHGGEEFYWSDFTVCTYEDGMLLFHYSKEGNIMRITVNANYSKNIFQDDEPLKEQDYNTVSVLAKQTNNEVIYISKDFISFLNNDSIGNTVHYAFWFDGELKIKWLDFYI
jgi:hypothetical protein